MSSAPCCANFWSHTIYDWGDVVPPVSYGDGISDAKCVVSGLQMDYRRFQNQAQLACYTNERDAIRAYDAATPITTNLMGTFKDLDYFEWAKEMDVVSWDNYPGMDTPPSFTAMCHDLMRGIGGNKPFMLMEQTPNQQNWFPFCKVKRPGEVRKLSWQAVSHGADTVQFFQMKQSIGGCERFHGAVIAHDGTEQSRVFKETAALGGELDRIGKRIMGSQIRAKVAIMFDWQSYWSLEAASDQPPDSPIRTKCTASIARSGDATCPSTSSKAPRLSTSSNNTIWWSRPPSSPCCRASPKRWNPTYPKAAAS